MLNKLDQIAPDQAAVVEQRIRAVNPTARGLRTIHADANPSQLLARAAARRAPVPDRRRHQGFGGRVSERQFPVDLAGGSRAHGSLVAPIWSVVRLKGFVRVAGKTEFQEVQWILGSFSMIPYTGNRQSRAKIVVIGRRVAWQRFLEGLEHCLVRPKRRTAHRRRAGKKVSR